MSRRFLFLTNFFLFAATIGSGLDRGAVSAQDHKEALAAGELWVDPKFGMRFRQIPAGEFQMGSPEGEAGRDSDETQHAVRLTRSLLLGETEVTQGQWQGLMRTAPSHFSASGTDCPVEKVSWWEALAFANRMSSESGLSSCYR